jgi:hypothetical protein
MYNLFFGYNRSFLIMLGFGVLTPEQVSKLIGVEIGGKDAGVMLFLLS